jgi:GT2 family glycosyltransferase
MNVRDGAPWIRDAIDSVLYQTFQDWELIVWDDRSTDDSAAIVREYQDGRVRYFLSPQATPLGQARLDAMRQARGEWVAFLDQDDIWTPHKLERQMALADSGRESNIALVYGRAVMLFPNGKLQEFDVWHEFRPLPEGDILEELFWSSCFIVISSAILKRAALEDFHAPQGDFQIVSDYYFFLFLARRYAVRAVQEVVCFYRVHPGSLSRSRRQQMHQEALRLVERWGDWVDPRAAAWGRMRHSNLLAFEEMRRPKMALRGLRRLFVDGSPMFVASRPFVRAYRAVRRVVREPYWKRSYPERPGRSSSRVAVADTGKQASRPALVLSVVIVNWKVRELLRECLAHLYADSGLPRHKWEVIVVDNASVDGTPEMLREEFPAVTLIENGENVGFGKANNQALGITGGEYVLLLNPDTVVLDGAVDRMIETLTAHPDAAALGCRLVSPDGSTQRFTAGHAPGLLNVASYYLLGNRLLPRWIRPKPLFMEQEPGQTEEVGWVSGACMLLRRAALEGRIFDERFFMYGEDVEACLRLGTRGWKILYSPEMQILHYGGTSRELQEPKLRLRNLHGLREVFLTRNGFSCGWLFDLIMITAFLVRAVVFEAAALARPAQGFKKRAEVSRQMGCEAVRLLFSGAERDFARAPVKAGSGTSGLDPIRLHGQPQPRGESDGV